MPGFRRLNLLFTLVAACLAMLTGVCATAADPPYGSTPQNAANLGWVVQKGNWVYYIDSAWGITRMTADGKNAKQIYAEVLVDRLFLVGDWLYFTEAAAEDRGNDGTYRLSTAGGRAEKLFDSDRRVVFVLGEWFYYLDLSTFSGLYRCGRDGGEPIEIAGGAIETVCAYNGKLYYENGFKLMRCDFDGGRKESLADGVTAFSFGDDGIYYLCKYAIMKMRYDGTQKQQVLPNRRASELIAAGKRLFFAWYGYPAKDGPLTRLLADGSEEKVIFDGFACQLNLVGDWLYFFHNDDRTGANKYRIRLDGSGLAALK